MGKVKRKKIASDKHNPTGLVSIREIELEAEEEQTEGTPDSFIASISEKLQSTQTEEKCSACNKLAGTTDATVVTEVLKSDIVKIVAPLLFHRNHLVRHTASGALRNLSVNGGSSGCDRLIELDVMTPVVHLLKKKYGTDWTVSKSCFTKNRLDAEADTFLQTLHLLFNLCESSSTCVTIFTSKQLLPILLRCLNPKEFTMKISIIVAHCLHIVSEDNSEICEALTDQVGVFENLLQIADDDASLTLLKVVVAGILLNVNGGRISMCSIPHITLIMNQLSEALKYDHREFVSRLVENLVNLETPEGQTSLMETHLHALEDIMLAQQTALEILTNICSGEEDEWEAISSNSSDDAMPDVECEEEDGMDCTAPCSANIPIEAEEVLVSGMLIPKILEKVDPVERSLRHQLAACSRTKHLISRFSTIRNRALSCFHNLVCTLGVDELGGGQALYEIWCKLGLSVFKSPAVHDASHLEAATSVLRAVLQKLGESDNSRHMLQITPGDLTSILQVGLTYEDTGVRVNIVKIMGMLGSLLAQIQEADTSEQLKIIGEFLLEVSCNKDVDLWLCAEALDALFDAFAEDHTDGAAQAVGLVEKLRTIVPVLKRKMKTQRKKMAPEQWSAVVTAKSNLVRFLEYKAAQPKYANGAT